jgi:tetratricopeptide (TPR) repeat protein
LAEGEFRFKVAENYSWSATHNADGQRVTHRASDPDARPEIWLFGCSFTYGWSLDDNQTLAARLAPLWPQFRIRSFAVPGFGTTQSYLSLKRELEKGAIPAIVYYGYGSFHETRNILSRDRQRAFARTDPQAIHLPPFARLDPKGNTEIVFEPPYFVELPGMRWSSLLTLIEGSYDNLEMQWLPSQQVTWKLLKEMNDLCRAKGVDFIVGTWTRDPLTDQLLAHARETKLPVVELAMPTEAEGSQNLPFDGHPSAKFHRYSAEEVATRLAEMMPSRFDSWQRVWARARTLRKDRRFAEALAEIARARTDPPNAVVLYESALNEIAVDYQAQARFDLEECLKSRPDWNEARGALARVQALASNPSVRQSELSLITCQDLANGNNRANPWFVETRAICLASTGRWDEAVRLAESASQMAGAMSAPATQQRLSQTVSLLRERQLPPLLLSDIEGPLGP